MRINGPDRTHLPVLRQLWKEAFGDEDTFLDVFFSTAFSPERCRCVFEENRPVAALYWFNQQCYGKPMAYLYGVATRLDWRGRGLCRALIADTHNHLAQLGYAGVMLVPASRQLAAAYRRMGYENATKAADIFCEAGEKTVLMRQVSGREYIGLRRALLPAGGVQLAEEHMPFLETQAELYAGTDFLLTAVREDDRLMGVELLGNHTLCPEILKTLGAKQGTFRIPGEKLDFAMYHCLDGMTLPPAYFGLAFQ